MPWVANTAPTGEPNIRQDSRLGFVVGSGYAWRPASDADRFELLVDGVDLFAACIREAASQQSDNRDSADRRAELAAALAAAFKLHARPNTDFAFPNASISKRIGETDDLWGSVVSLYEALAARLQSRRAGTAMPVVTFVRYRGSNRKRPAMWQLWIRVTTLQEGHTREPPFVLNYPILTTVPLLASAGGNVAMSSIPDTTEPWRGHVPYSTGLTANDRVAPPTLSVGDEPRSGVRSSDPVEGSHPDSRVNNGARPADVPPSLADDSPSPAKPPPLQERPAAPNSGRRPRDDGFPTTVIAGIDSLGARLLGYMLAAGLLYQVVDTLIGNVFWRFGAILGSISEFFGPWSIR